MQHQGLCTVHYELIHTSDGVRANLGGIVFEELQELGNHEVERAIECVAVEHVRRVLADLLERAERTFHHIVIFLVEEHAKARKEFRPRRQLAFGGDCRDQDSYRGANQRRRVSDRVETFRLDKFGDFGRKLVQVGADIVLENEAR